MQPECWLTLEGQPENYTQRSQANTSGRVQVTIPRDVKYFPEGRHKVQCPYLAKKIKQGYLMTLHEVFNYKLKLTLIKFTF